MKPPKLDRGTFAIVGAVSAYVGLQIFAAGVEWERERAQKLEAGQVKPAPAPMPLDLEALQRELDAEPDGARVE